MKKIFLSIIILFSFNFNAISHVNHYSKFNYLEYELFRNNQLIGYHKYDFLRKNNNLTIKSEVSFDITKLGVELYKYFATSEEIYENGNFAEFSSKTNQNKKKKYVNIKFNYKSQILSHNQCYFFSFLIKMSLLIHHQKLFQVRSHYLSCYHILTHLYHLH
mgnify:CR=1 FL=1